jgi:ribosomal protein S18 acetylase RimI-like enzyme
MTIIVRRATVADAAAVAALNVDVQALHAAAMPGEFKPPGPGSFTRRAAAALLRKQDHLVFIAEINAEPAGYAAAEVIRRPETPFKYAREMVYLSHISVRPEYRRRGVGQALLAAVRAAGEAAGITLLALDVWSFNEDARAFFRRSGFAPYVERLWNQ